MPKTTRDRQGLTATALIEGFPTFRRRFAALTRAFRSPLLADIGAPIDPKFASESALKRLKHSENGARKSAARHDVNDPLRRTLGRYPARATGVVHVMAW